ncbi:topoisomerase II-associated protein PAT1 [Lojkania enalia]|uniref:Topoisomerase II-associated protein PAT1 n=1 Tax=Lojkania enalia TaxID=147567 RepID=A0A9P4KBN0_9PLEO|nr:topoisomerase II-associated protein PAT1 [Didymosphaeria enalia]
MSFFGFDTTLPKDQGHSANAPGFGQVRDAFAGLGGGAQDDDDAIDFEDTYDGLGDQLDDTDDAFNDDTFGGGPATQQSIGRDFDFAGQTSQIANTILEEQMLFQARNPQHKQKTQFEQKPTPQPPKPTRSGYESYNDPSYIPQLEVRSDIWGIKPKTAPAKQIEHQAPTAPAKKIMSLEEIEAMMRAQPTQETSAPLPTQPTSAQASSILLHHQQNLIPHSQSQLGVPPQYTPQILQRPHQPSQAPPASRQQQQVHVELPGHPVQAPPTQPTTILQRQRSTPNEPMAQHQQQQRHAPQQLTAHRPPSQPRQILKNPNRLSGHGQQVQGQRSHVPGHSRGPSFPGMAITHPDQLLQMTEEERTSYLEEDAKRAKRNHKIALLSKDNGLMTPQDKNFITRIQLQQLMAATGNLEGQGSETALAEDFYFQVFSQIRGAPRQTPHQPANQFAQTYLFQTNSRYGPGRRQGRGGDNHMQRMEQQVQRAVEAAKAKPKGKQLVIEGSLGKIAFSNAKTPRPLLSIKRPETGDKHPSKTHKSSVADRKEVLRNIENVYMTLMHMEDHARLLPPPINEESPAEAIQEHLEWRTKIEALHKKLWEDIKIMEPINPHALIPHPFIAILSHAKGKKAISRIFRHIDEQERITVVTMIVVHLDNLSVVSHAIATPDEPLTPAIREEVELFSHAVMPPLFAHISESPLNIIIGLLGLLLDRTNLHIVARSKVGVSLLTILISRAELLKQSTPEIDIGDWEQWTELYNRLFDVVEPVLPEIFPGTVNDTDDMYVWQFLAAMGVGASPEQQQRLVIGVKDRVMETVTVCKALPPEMAGPRLANVNLFMRAIGLDVELLG